MQMFHHQMVTKLEDIDSNTQARFDEVEETILSELNVSFDEFETAMFAAFSRMDEQFTALMELYGDIKADLNITREDLNWIKDFLINQSFSDVDNYFSALFTEFEAQTTQDEIHDFANNYFETGNIEFQTKLNQFFQIICDLQSYAVDADYCEDHIQDDPFLLADADSPYNDFRMRAESAASPGEHEYFNISNPKKELKISLGNLQYLYNIIGFRMLLHNFIYDSETLDVKNAYYANEYLEDYIGPLRENLSAVKETIGLEYEVYLSSIINDTYSGYESYDKYSESWNSLILETDETIEERFQKSFLLALDDYLHLYELELAHLETYLLGFLTLSEVEDWDRPLSSSTFAKRYYTYPSTETWNLAPAVNSEDEIYFIDQDDDQVVQTDQYGEEIRRIDFDLSGTDIVIDGQDNIYLYNQGTASYTKEGVLRWEKNIDETYYTLTCAVGPDGLLYLVTRQYVNSTYSDPVISICDPADGLEVWSQTVEVDASIYRVSNFAFGDDNTFYILLGNDLYAFSTENNTSWSEVWAGPTGCGSLGGLGGYTLIVDDTENLYFSGGPDYELGITFLSSVDSSGEWRWTIRHDTTGAGKEFWSGNFILLSNDKLVMSTVETEDSTFPVYILNTSDGSVSDTLNLSGYVPSRMAAGDDNTFYLIAKDSECVLYAFDGSGQELWTLTYPNYTFSSLNMNHEGDLIFLSSWGLYGVNTSADGLGGPWPKHSKSYGNSCY